MKTITLIPTLLATILAVGPGLAKEAVKAEHEIEIALEAQVQAVEDAAEKAGREVERNLRSVEKQLRLAQGQAGQAMAAAGPAIKRAFGATFINTAEPPLVIATSKLDAAALAELREDLNVMSKLVKDVMPETSDNKAMGISLNWLPNIGGRTDSLYVEGSGAIIQVSVRFPLMPPQKEESKPAAEPPKNSAWESARRELYGGKSADETEIVVFPPDKREEYNAERVENLKKEILQALANANNFRRLGEKEAVTVVVRNRGANRSEIVMFQSADPHGRVQRSSGGGEDSTMTIRVKKADAEALAAGKIKEEEFQKRAQVAIY